MTWVPGRSTCGSGSVPPARPPSPPVPWWHRTGSPRARSPGWGGTFSSKATFSAMTEGAGCLMSGDLLVIVPTRGRPGNLARLLDAVHATRTSHTNVHAAVDDDDPELDAYR